MWVERRKSKEQISLGTLGYSDPIVLGCGDFLFEVAWVFLDKVILF